MNNFKPGEIKEYFDYAHDKIRDNLGPPNLQFMESILDGYQCLKSAGGEMNDYKAKLAKLTAMGVYATLHSIKRLYHSPVVRERALMLERRYRDEMGNPHPVATVASRYITRNLRKEMLGAPEEVVSDPPPRWTYYNTDGPEDRVYVRKGRKARKAKPYKNHHAVKVKYLRN